MSQHDFDIANAAGASVRADINLALLAVVSQSSGATEPATKYAYQWWADTSSGKLKFRNGANNAWVEVGTLDQPNLALLALAGGAMTGDIEFGAAAHLVALPLVGQCRFEYTSTTVCTLVPWNGHLLMVKTGTKWKARKIPAAGITLGNGGLSANTTYYVYCYDNAGTLTLEASATTHAACADAGAEGVRIKSGDATRTLVGMVRTSGAAQFQQDLTPGAGSQAYIGVLSHFNRRPITARNVFSVSPRTRNNTAAGEIHSEIRINFLTWGDEVVHQRFSGRVYNDNAGGQTLAYANLDGATTVSLEGGHSTNANQQIGVSPGGDRVVSEGWHYGTLEGSNSSGDPGNFTFSNGNGQTVTVRG